MDLVNNKFGKGPRELTGAVDLVKYYKLFPHYEFFCKKSHSLSVSDAHYLHNIVGDTEIRKGEGMQLNQLIRDDNNNKVFSRETSLRIHPFDLNALGHAFHLRETAPIELTDSQKGVPTQAGRSKTKPKDKETKHKKHKHGHKDRNKDKKDKNDKIRHHEKKRKVDGDDNPNAIHIHQNTKYKRPKMDKYGVIRISSFELA